MVGHVKVFGRNVSHNDGTDSSTFQLNGTGSLLKDVAGVIQIRNAGDTDFASLRANVTGTDVGGFNNSVLIVSDGTGKLTSGTLSESSIATKGTLSTENRIVIVNASGAVTQSSILISDVLIDSDIGSTVASQTDTRFPTADEKAALAGEGTPSGTNKYTTKSYVDGLVQGIDWQDSVLDRATAPAGGESGGERYLVIATATGDFEGEEDNIAEYNGTGWDFTTVSEGMATWVEDEDILYVYNGSAWVKFGSTTTHNITSGLQGGTTDEYYHLTSTQHTTITGIAGLSSADSNFIVGSATGWVVESGSDARTSLGLGTIATQASNSVDIDGGAIDGTTIGANSETTGKFTTVQSTVTTGTAPLIIASTTLVSNLNADLLDGNEASAFSLTSHDHSGVYQPVDTLLTNIAALTTVDNNFIVATGSDTVEVQTPTQVKTTLGLGTMAEQNASSVTITGGTISGVGIKYATRTVTDSTDDVVLTDHDVYANTSSNTVTLTLPAVSGNNGVEFFFQKIHASNTMNVECDGSETFEDGSSTNAAFTAINSGMTVKCVNGKWKIMMSDGETLS